jgi:cysteinyl-tRNA synthetase
MMPHEMIDYFYRALDNLITYKVEVPEEFISYLNDDLNLSEAFSYMRELAKKIHKADTNSNKEIFASMLKACG